MITKYDPSSATAEKGAKYNLNKNVLEAPQRFNLFSGKKPWEEMLDTARMFGKWKTFDERKTFSIILSPADTDTVKPEQLAELERVIHERYFKDYAGIGVVHFAAGEDKKKPHPIMHGHMLYSTVNIKSGKSFHLSPREYRRIQDFVDDYVSRNFGWMVIDRTKPKTRKYSKERPSDESQSWVAAVAKAVDKALYSKDTYNLTSFARNLQRNGIYFITKARNGAPLKSPAFGIVWKDKDFYRISGKSLGAHLTWEGLRNRFNNLTPEKAASAGVTYAAARGLARKTMNTAAPKQSKQVTTSQIADDDSNTVKGRQDFGCLLCPDMMAMAAGKCDICIHQKRAIGHHEEKDDEYSR